ncbi:DUF2585 family protein [Mesorhizobium qingshengii]|uniref:Uncharacterized protein n=1 Tax=Mesorhizobium qingshengii TaxID=1165689 RepID=A0A1G5ZS75_9HYPH|nr:DUF2585 family protein [Mesorhizobium qingshengii]SDA97671.1 Protein of unknown function [Mesorhizobium qingshengii]
MASDKQFGPKVEGNAAKGTRKQRSFVPCILIVVALLGAQAVAVASLGHPWICTCGSVEFWYPDPAGPWTSQHLTDWYSFTHILHGFGFYALLWLIAPRASFGSRLLLAIGLEAAWEIVENTPMVIDRYRQQALARGYFGDSVLNSLSDTVFAASGFALARILPVWTSALVVVGTEVFLGYMIHDNLTLNILQLIRPSEVISRWQLGG